MKGYVKSVVPSKSGKAWRVQIGDKFYGANFDSKLDTAVGQSIDFDYDDGKFGLWIKTWGPDHTSTPTPPSQAAVAPPRESSGVSNGGDRFWLNFVSNCVGQAIAKGTITNEGQIMAWALAAYTAMNKVDRSDDDINF